MTIIEDVLSFWQVMSKHIFGISYFRKRVYRIIDFSIGTLCHFVVDSGGLWPYRIEYGRPVISVILRDKTPGLLKAHLISQLPVLYLENENT